MILCEETKAQLVASSLVEGARGWAGVKLRGSCGISAAFSTSDLRSPTSDNRSSTSSLRSTTLFGRFYYVGIYSLCFFVVS